MVNTRAAYGLDTLMELARRRGIPLVQYVRELGQCRWADDDALESYERLWLSGIRGHELQERARRMIERHVDPRSPSRGVCIGATSYLSHPRNIAVVIGRGKDPAW